jgi:HPt (histidine-containing phosphotransfer) domain-containing protein
MTEVTDPAIAKLLAEARLQFAASVPAKVADLRALMERGAWEDARRAAHKLRGSTGTYGLPDLSVVLGEIEDHLIEVACAPGGDLQRRLIGRAREALTLAERAAGGP